MRTENKEGADVCCSGIIEIDSGKHAGRKGKLC